MSNPLRQRIKSILGGDDSETVLVEHGSLRLVRRGDEYVWESMDAKPVDEVWDSQQMSSFARDLAEAIGYKIEGRVDRDLEALVEDVMDDEAPDPGEVEEMQRKLVGGKAKIDALEGQLEQARLCLRTIAAENIHAWDASQSTEYLRAKKEVYEKLGKRAWMELGLDGSEFDDLDATERELRLREEFDDA